MPIYTQHEYKTVISRIQNKLKDRNISLGECLLQDEVAVFEKSCNIQLPQAYRLFLLHVGDGCDFNSFHLNHLNSIQKRDLSTPFLLENYWIWEDDTRDSIVVKNEIQTKAYQGNIELCNRGCGESYNLIVSGKCRGEMWNFTDVGVQPCCEWQDFLGWFELWLDNQDKTDYFKDFKYK